MELKNKKITILDKGYVQLKDWMGYDFKPEETARISTGSEGDRKEEQRTILTRYLMRHKHTSPFEFNSVDFEVKAPIMVFRQWHRHRTVSINEESGRYKQLEPDYYIPSLDRICNQSKFNHQGTDFNNQHPHASWYQEIWSKEQKELEEFYDCAVKDGVANEIARLNMPVSHYSTMRINANLLNWFRFCQLREDGHAQYEIREYAEAIHSILLELFPQCTKAYEDYWLNSLTLSFREQKELKNLLNILMTDGTDLEKLLDENIQQSSGPHWTKRERQEFIDKILKL